MDIILLSIHKGGEPWLEEFTKIYQKKISAFMPFQSHVLKSKSSAGRTEKENKIKKEAEQILSFIKPSDFVVLLDEKGKTFTSMEFASQLDKILSLGKHRIVFVVGGAFGVDDSIKERSQLRISLSSFTFNHLLARAVFLEQLYRAFCIVRSIPYHNE